MKSLNKTGTLIFYLLFISNGNLLDFYFTVLQLVLVRVAAVERLPYFTIVQIIFSFPLGSLVPLLYLWKWIYAHAYTRGRKECCKLHYCLWRVSIKPRLPFSICIVFFVSKGNLLDFYLIYTIYGCCIPIKFANIKGCFICSLSYTGQDAV